MRFISMVAMGFLVACGGPEGPEGQIGPSGPIGPAGNPGLNGANGQDGEDGILGEDGEDGEDGVDGVDGASDYVFRSDAATAYTRVDRMAMPAVATAVITSKDDYNDADPVDDDALDFAAEIEANVTGIHAALDDDLTGLGLTPCAVADCLAAAGPLIIPDTLLIDTSAGAGFPNGRMLTDNVIDITLAVVLLDLGTHGLGDLIGALNPVANDKPFMGMFPYTAAPHQ